MRPLLYGQGHGAPPSTVSPRLLPEVKRPPLALLPRGSGEGRRPDGSWDQHGGKPQRGGGTARGWPGLALRRGVEDGRGGRGPRRAGPSLLRPGSCSPAVLASRHSPAGQLPHPFSRTPRRHGGSLGLACAPSGVGVSL